MPKKKKEHSAKKLAHAPLGAVTKHAELSKKIDEKGMRRHARIKNDTNSEDDEEEGPYVPVAVSRKVMELAREQQDEIEREIRAKKQKEEDDMVDEDNLNNSFGNNSLVDDIDSFMAKRDGEYVDAIEVDADDEATLAQFMPSQSTERRTLGDIIAEKIREKELADAAAKQGVNNNEGISERQSKMNDKVVQVYTSIGQILTRYRAGKIPKAFKIIPNLRNWEEVLWITAPDTWSPQAMFVATKLFASNLNPKHAQRYYNLILLPRVRDDIRANKKLNYHLYCAVKKSIYKPAAFFKGLLLPLAESACTLKEAMIVGSVMSKVSIPMMHSAAAMLKLTQLPYSGGTSIFLTVLMNKKYSLPYKVIDALAAHFASFQHETRVLPVLWHQSLLVFSQRYKLNLTQIQKSKIRDTLRKHQHPGITAEIRRELFTSRNRGDKTQNDDVVMM
eukprot:g4179.t1